MHLSYRRYFFNKTTLNATLGFLLTWTLFFLIALVISPSFLTYDSYHYLQLAIYPIFGDSHSVVFGFILKTLAEISLVFGPHNLNPALLIWNTFCLTALFHPCFIIFYNLKNFAFKYRTKLKTNLFCYFLLGLVITITLIGNLFLVNAFWSELTSLLMVAVLAVLIPSYLKSGKLVTLVITALLAAVAFHTRYLLIIMPVISLCIGLLPTVRSFKTKLFFDLLLLKRTVVLALAMFLAIAISNSVLQKNLPSSPIKNSVTAFTLSASLQCSLRCDVKMFQKDCSTAEGKILIEKSTCSEIIFGLVDVGTMSSDVSSLTNVFKQAGLWNSFRWIFMAPFTYFNDIHGLELGSFTFGADAGAAKDYPNVITYFKKYFPEVEQIQPSPMFSALIKILHHLFYDRFFHKLAILLLLGCAVILKKSRSYRTQFFALYAIGTFFLFAYLNPEVPFRFQMQIITPALISLILFCEERWLPKTKASA